LLPSSLDWLFGLFSGSSSVPLMTRTVNHQTRLIGIYSAREVNPIFWFNETVSFDLAAIMRILASSPVQVKSHSTLQDSAAPKPTVKAWLLLRHLRCLFCSPSITKLLISLSRQKAKSMAMGTNWNHGGANGLSPIHHACRTNYLMGSNVYVLAHYISLLIQNAYLAISEESSIEAAARHGELPSRSRPLPLRSWEPAPCRLYIRDVHVR
jgi:hypothetical protein